MIIALATTSCWPWSGLYAGAATLNRAMSSDDRDAYDVERQLSAKLLSCDPREIAIRDVREGSGGHLAWIATCHEHEYTCGARSFYRPGCAPFRE